MDLDTITPDIFDYIQGLTAFDDPVLKEMEERGRRDGFPIIGPLVGPWLYFFARTIESARVFELGSGFGYSTFYFAKVMQELGRGNVMHTVWDDKLSGEAKRWLEKAGLVVYCDFEVSESILALETAEPGIDLAFMDIDKEAYPDAISTLETKLRPGGLLLVDNTIWSGKVVGDGDGSEATSGVKRMNEMLSKSDRWDYLIIPLRDGLGVARFRG